MLALLREAGSLQACHEEMNTLNDKLAYSMLLKRNEKCRIYAGYENWCRLNTLLRVEACMFMQGWKALPPETEREVDRELREMAGETHSTAQARWYVEVDSRARETVIRFLEAGEPIDLALKGLDGEYKWIKDAIQAEIATTGTVTPPTESGIAALQRKIAWLEANKPDVGARPCP